ncbi:PAS domain-containing protein, partial [Streptomyces roseolus]|uniref:PAS domain-containing protein n=1 Tax=Streptomyces roseolus TaxID=67358 RepID=UPI00365BB7CD
MWPQSHPPSLTRRERGHILSTAHRITRILDRSPTAWSIPAEPRTAPLPGYGTDPARTGLAADDLLQRLPVGALGFDLQGRITYLNDAAARLLGRSADSLLGTLPWQAVPWLDAPVHEDHYRAAVFGREPVGYTAPGPSDRWFDIRLYPGDSGITAFLSPSLRGPAGHRPPPHVTTGTPTPPQTPRTAPYHHFLHQAPDQT